MHQNLLKRLDRLQQKLPPRQRTQIDDRAILKQRRTISQRLLRIVGEAEQLMTADETDRIAKAFGQWLDKGDGPFRHWLEDLADSKCRLPEITPQAMKDVLLAWLSPKCDFYRCICRRCGMEYPHMTSVTSEWKVLPGKVPLQGPPPWYDVPAVFTACPGCGASCLEMEWAHLLAGHTPWMELDGRVRLAAPHRHT